MRQGRLDRQSYERLRSFDQRTAYERLFADLAVPDGESALKTPDPSWGGQLFDVLVQHGVTGLDAFGRRLTKRLVGREEAGGLRGFLGRLLVKAGRTLCR